jgi:putative membrane protein
MLEFLLSWVFAALALVLADRLFRGVHLDGDFGTALVVAAVFGLLKLIFFWIFFVLLGLATLGIGFIFYLASTVVCTALVLKLTSALSRRFRVDGFMPALGTAVLIMLASELSQRIAF